VVVWQGAICRALDVAAKPGAARVNVGTFAGEPDRFGVLDRGRNGFADPPEPVEDRLRLLSDQVIELVLSIGFDARVLNRSRGPETTSRRPPAWGARTDRVASVTTDTLRRNDVLASGVDWMPTTAGLVTTP